MADSKSRTELLNVAAEEILIRVEGRTAGNQFTAEQIFTDGSDVNLLLTGASVMGETISAQNAQNISDLTLSGAKDDALDRVVADRFSPSVVRKQAAPSVGELTFSRSSIAAGAVNYNSGSIVETSNGTRFEILQTVAFGASSYGPITVDARAVEAGIAGNVSANTITNPVTSLPDGTIVFTNSTFFSGGANKESDDAFIDRAKRSFDAERRGTKGAIEYGALTVEGVVQATAYEPLDSTGQLTGFVFLYIADANGQANDQLISLVNAALPEYRGEGAPVDIFGATPTYVTVTLNLRYRSNINSQNAFEQVRDTIIAAINALDPNTILERALIIKACKSVDGVIVLDDAVVAPAGDIVPSDGEIFKTRADLILQAA
jgi:hypothetical protein